MRNEDPIFVLVRAQLSAWARNTFIIAHNASKAWGFVENEHELLLSCSRQVQQVVEQMEIAFGRSVDGRSFTKAEWAAAVHDFGRRFTTEILRQAYGIATKQQEETP